MKNNTANLELASQELAAWNNLNAREIHHSTLVEFRHIDEDKIQLVIEDGILVAVGNASLLMIDLPDSFMHRIRSIKMDVIAETAMKKAASVYVEILCDELTGVINEANRRIDELSTGTQAVAKFNEDITEEIARLR